MNGLEPSYYIEDTSKNVRAFVKANHSLFVEILYSVLPYIIVLYIADVIITGLYFPESKIGFIGGQLLASFYFMPVIAITWNRVVINGPEDFITMDPLRPKMHELQYIVMQVLLGFVVGFLGGTIVIVAGFIYKGLVLVAIPVVFLAAIYYGLRVSCFYFPAKAVDRSLTLKEAYVMSKGYLVKIIFSSLFASIWVILLLMLVGIVIAVGADILVSPADMEGGRGHLVNFIKNLPSIVYFAPLIGILMSTVSANYYLYALQNPYGTPEAQK